MDNNLVSVIIPMYNREGYIERCINSIINQTYENIEIIVVDDGSTDSSVKIIQECMKIDKRISLIQQANKGVSEARNTGIEKSRGTFISFIDSDDWIEENMYELIVNDILQNSTDGGVCSYIRDYPTKKEYEVLPFEKREILLDGNIYKNLIKNMISPENESYTPIMGSSCRCVFKRAIVEENNIFFNPKVSYCEDLIFCIEYFLKCSRVSIINEHLYHYFYNDKSAIERYDEDLFNKHIKVNSILNELLMNYKDEDLIYRLNKRFMICSISSMFNVFHYENNKNFKKKYIQVKIILNYLRENIFISNYKPENIKYKILRLNNPLIVYIIMRIKAYRFYNNLI